MCFISVNNLVQSSTISEYDLGGEGDLFNAPKAIIGESSVDIDPMTAAISMISCGDDAICSQGLEANAMETMQSAQLFSEVFYDCKRDLLAQTSIERPIFELCGMGDIKVPTVNMDTSQIEEKPVCEESTLQKSVSSCCLSSMECRNEITVRPNFLDFPTIDFDSVYGMRRAYSEGDIKTLGNGNVSIVQSPSERSTLLMNCSFEERQEKLNRYRSKKTKRNFGRKIKYACRKALADSQPRVRGRFAKTE
uniref:CCT domain-containing protein n=1 Tax=Kalanchoe fedtschenkoi TaxID=63787 RepID=A0A7N0U291_KALFE